MTGGDQVCVVSSVYSKYTCTYYTPTSGCVTSAYACKCIHDDDDDNIITLCNIVVRDGMTQKQKSKTGFIF